MSVVGLEVDGVHADRRQIAMLMRGMNANEDDSGLESTTESKVGPPPRTTRICTAQLPGRSRGHNAPICDVLCEGSSLSPGKWLHHQRSSSSLERSSKFGIS
jgi:hypothetical protein